SEVSSRCYNCRKKVNGALCHTCRRFGLKCAICHVAVRGASNVCMACGHGGHTFHIMQWFENMSVCPTGCGCTCL
ncbi:WD repeat-containing protein 59, partial [Exaiptasia diaphana]